MPHQWIIPTILSGLSLFLLAVWVPVWRENRKKKM